MSMNGSVTSFRIRIFPSSFSKGSTVEFITLDAVDYDTALKQARAQYGPLVRVHARKDYVSGSVFQRRRGCLLTFYLVQPQERPSEVEPPKEPVEEREEIPEQEERTHLVDEITSKMEGEAFIRDLLQLNDFSEEYIEEAIQALFCDEHHENKETLQMRLLEYIIDTVQIDQMQYAHPKKFFILLGPTGVGKTTTLVKMAVLYSKLISEDIRLNVALLSLDIFRAGASNQIEIFAQELDLDVFHAQDEEELTRLMKRLEAYDLVLVDTMGRSAKEEELSLHLKSLLSVLPKEESTYALAFSASQKGKDMQRFVKVFSSYPLSCLIVTKLDETGDVGNILSVSKKSDIPLLFFTDGQQVPQDLHKATNEQILPFLEGFSLDFSTMQDK